MAPARRKFPPGTDTQTFKVTVSQAEHDALTQHADKLGVPLAEFLVKSALAPKGRLSTPAARDLGFKLIAVQDVLASIERRMAELGQGGVLLPAEVTRFTKAVGEARTTRRDLDKAIERLVR